MKATKILTRYLIQVVICLTFAGSIALTGYAQSVSVLGDITCAFNNGPETGNHTCGVQSTGQSGLVSCQFQATCLSPKCTVPSVSAFRGVGWSGCGSPITVAAQGGTLATLNPSVSSAVFAVVKVSGAVISNETSGEETDDCFEGDVVNDPPITGIC